MFLIPKKGAASTLRVNPRYLPPSKARVTREFVEFSVQLDDSFARVCISSFLVFNDSMGSTI